MKHTIIKLGGSVITDKGKLKTLKTSILQDLIEVINQYPSEKEEKIWLFHGAGSFGHISAQKWNKTKNDEYFYKAAAEVSALNTTIQTLLKIDFEAISGRHFWDKPHQQWQASSEKSNVFLGHGDAVEIKDKKEIVSADTQITSLAEYFTSEPKRILFLGDTDGVLDTNKKTISELSTDTLPVFFDNQKADVTGSMAKKLEQAFSVLNNQTNITLSSGKNPQNLRRWLRGETILGTQLIQT